MFETIRVDSEGDNGESVVVFVCISGVQGGACVKCVCGEPSKPFRQITSVLGSLLKQGREIHAPLPRRSPANPVCQ